MNKSYFSIFILLLIGNISFAQQPLSYYLPQNVTYDQKVPSPQQFLGFQIGEQHVSHDQIVAYMKELDRTSDRVTLQEYARTYENRPCLLLTISSTENQKNIDEIRKQHLKLSEPSQSASVNLENMPAVVWMGYSVHGNEPSGANANMMVSYFLAAAQGAEVDQMLKNTVILIDPAINPDGIQRFSSWVNANKSNTLVSDNNSREFSEPWPNGRTNHYWFDLNRDWLPLQHNESKGRLQKFHEWKPLILTDHHEQGTNATFFFQPGIPSRTNPLTPQINQDLTAKMGKYHAEALDKIGSLYFTKEAYDDFYYGKGSTYPDINGSIGILFEQASSRGHAQESVNGVLTFPFTIRNQVVTSFSTLKAAQVMRLELLNNQRNFYKNALNLAKADPVKGYVFGDGFNKATSWHLLDILRRHQIEVYKLAANSSQGGKNFQKDNSFVVPLNQSQYTTIKAIFTKQTKFRDSLFYDISAWTFPLAFNLPYSELSSVSGLTGSKVEDFSFPKGRIYGGKSQYAYLFEWNEFYAPKALNELLKAGIRAKVSQRNFSMKLEGEIRNFDYGTILIQANEQTLNADELYNKLAKLAEENAIDVYAAGTGVTEGINLGSSNFKLVEQPKIALLTGQGVNNNDAGEVWHLLDQRFNMPPTLLEQSRLSRMNLDKYTVMIMAEGSYSGLTESGKEEIKRWLRNGGVLIAIGNANRWTNAAGLSNIRYKEQKNIDSAAFRNYDTQQEIMGAQFIPGAIFQTRLDRTHPLAYGIKGTSIPVFREGTGMFDKPKNPFVTPLAYTDKPLLAGYISKENEKLLKGSASIICSNFGSGQVISFSDNPNFRAFWFGTSKLFMNAIFFGNTLRSTSFDGEE
ncbi:M14 metallopeptidase family protein [Daejeonella oryzae]|uniref:M14 metallopeptidase family protein n=1 Tax=Daejeonella oryzae TaxID=1122943 RepID=UPI0003FF8EFA|nr:M14 metallopeptidase family protein [Daejeonella oryzae]